MEKMNTLTASSLLSNLGMDEYNLFAEESHLKLLDVDDEKFLSHDIASVFEEQTPTSESTSTTLSNSNSFTDEISFDYFERPNKLLKMKTLDFTEKFSPPQISPSSSSPSTIISPFHSKILSFDNPNTDPPQTTQFYHGFDPKQTEIVLPQMGTTRRSPANAQDHVIAERKRRERLSRSFVALAALIPGLKKMDKASVLGDAVKYMKELKERLGVLEKESKNTKPDMCSDKDCSKCECDENIESVFQVEARVSKQEMMIRIHCQKHKGLLVKMMLEIQSLNLFVVNSSVLPFGDSILDITIIAQMGEGYNLTIKELVKKLRTAGLKFMS